MGKISIKSFEAYNGDAFLVSFDNNQNVLIDMGMPKTYDSEIKPELIKLALSGQKIDLLVISHVDEDHIGGAIEFLKDNQENNIIEVCEIWHNSYRHMQFEQNKVDKIDEDSKDILESLVQQNQSNSIDNGEKLISYKQGSSLASLIWKYDYSWNSSFNNNAVVNNSSNNTIKKIGDIKFVLLSPDKNKLNRLSKRWLKELNKQKYNFEISDEEIFDDAFEFFMKYEQDLDTSIKEISSSNKINFDDLAEVIEKDSSVTNGSSISFIIEYQGKRLLFLGDAHEDIIYENLNKLKDQGESLTFDFVKISHHGSNKNISQRFIDIIDSQRFFFSTDGTKHGHPNLEAISKILVKETQYQKELLFNYEVDAFKTLNNKDYESYYHYVAKHLNEVLL
ncbi:ComEC/Rec2 family competence protein [Sulfurovum sp. TSL1]|uniref:ComEC/Rec2 family competence protein n=1 Tax=Sulfurovum sp. TSL1 TaxID=2826994 RepID=UPI001CC4D177|nr:MBL fold metallo-hydrolase [Sulfurovum sp. TSL1]GIT97915.1 hypothetical protein TSL1_07360 [Sulfurovum sp. TSL1]